jgi:tRNA threonylcarbamoyl adenosine modification protein YeaZ
MKILAIDCATEACSAAVFERENGLKNAAPLRLIGGLYETIGRGHAERLVPMIQDLPDKGRADSIHVGLGPGSFTGTRIALATARALGVAWSVPVLGFSTLALVAAQAIARAKAPVTVCMAGGHGQWFVQNFSAESAAETDYATLDPAVAAMGRIHSLIAGNKAADLAERSGVSHDILELLPDARHANLLLQSALISAEAPIYGRPPDAKPQAKSARHV